MLKTATIMTAFAALAVATPASAAVSISVFNGSPVYSGPTPTYTFDVGSAPNYGAPISGGTVITTGTTAGSHAQPLGSTGNYWSVGPVDGTVPALPAAQVPTGIMDLSSFGSLFNVSFIWGSVDSYNTLQLLDAANNVLYTFVGNDVFNPANGNQGSPFTNPIVRLNISGADSTLVKKLRLSSSQNAFETDNFAINAVPEPATWALMLLGFGAVGFSMRRGRRATPRLSAMA